MVTRNIIFETFSLPNRIYKTKKMSISGKNKRVITDSPEVDAIIENSLTGGYIVFPQMMNSGRLFFDLRNTYYYKCMENNQTCIEFFIYEKKDKGYMVIDNTTKTDKSFKFDYVFVEKELEAYYSQFDAYTSANLRIPKGLSVIEGHPNYEVTHKKIAVSFLLSDDKFLRYLMKLIQKEQSRA